MAITDWPSEERPREKMLKHGGSVLSDSELLAIFLRIGIKGKSAVELARDLLTRFDGLRGVMDATADQFAEVPGMGPAKWAQLQACLELGQRYLQTTLSRGEAFTSPMLTRQFLQARLRAYHHEVFACLFLDNQNRLIRFEELFTGTIDCASVYPREVVKRVLSLNAAAVIFAHNHPSGIAEPSQSDRHITQRLQSALGLIDVRVLDHFVVGDAEVVSMAERGLI
ncbi:JAB domain-containing protein [Ketobacter sp. MCCC 1A13808]|uniref:RadC family protein n=1 Tax=Ketobacter sp. MCCC 1A13808 TaxID=2602738 RepID=UPI0012EB1532|nr:DNA repair protein RadC [Ketobacter sp. MCCC 1A13808]MVF12104.1 JAB domain-containing protein [Ketobacter sp. MCCC 1A13808]